MKTNADKTMEMDNEELFNFLNKITAACCHNRDCKNCPVYCEGTDCKCGLSNWVTQRIEMMRPPAPIQVSLTDKDLAFIIDTTQRPKEIMPEQITQVIESMGVMKHDS